MITKEIGVSIWQTSFYDRIIDNDNGYEAAWQYIDDNKTKWAED